MKLSKRFKVVREAFGKHFSEALVLLFFWLILHLFIAAHSVLIPDFTALLSQAHWSFILFFALICATTFLMNEKTYERLFDINLKQTLEIDFAFVVFGKVPLKMRMLMLSFLAYVLCVGSTISALIATFFSYGNEVILWVLYLAFLFSLLFLIKCIFSAWMHTYQQFFLQSLEEEK